MPTVKEAKIERTFLEMNERIAHLEKMLFLGDGDRLPLAEVVRNLTKTVNDYIAQKDKEEEQKRDEWKRLKWLIVGVVVPLIFVFIGQAIVFYVRVFPIIEKLSP